MIPILYLSHCGSCIGGAEKQLLYLVTHLDRNRYQPLVVCPDDDIFAAQLRAASVPTVILNLPPWRKAKSRLTRYNAARKLTAITKRHNTQLIHTSDPWLNPYLWYTGKRLNIPIVSHVRTVLTPEQVQKYQFAEMTHIIAISEQSKLPLVQAGICSEKIDVILNCVDLSVFCPAPVRESKKGEAFSVGIVGRIEPFKQQKTFIEIAAEVVARHQNVRFYIIGAALDTREHRVYLREVRQLIAERQLDEVICLSGHRTDMPEAMQELDLLITLSAGSVIAEAMASGKPVIGTSIGSTAEMIVHGVTGYIMPLDPPAVIAHQIIELATAPELCIQMGTAGRRRAEAAFGIETHIQKIQDVYKHLLNHS